MKNKIVCMVMTSLFLLTSVISISTVGIENKATETTNNDGYVEMVYPLDRGYVYIGGEPVLYVLGRSIIIGSIDVRVNASEDVESVTFKLNGEDVYTDDEAPFEWNWNKLCFGICIVEAYAEVNGEIYSHTIKPAKIF